MRPRSSSDPSEQKARAPLAPMAPKAPTMRTEVAHWGQKSSSGYVGLSNQGATCYLNSLLQCLYMTPEFRHALFTWNYKPPANTSFDFEFNRDDSTDIEGIYDAPPEHSIPFQLQCLFARLHKSCRGACSTKALTKSFHWTDGEAFQQHDVQELLRVLFDAVSRALCRVGKGQLLNNLCKGMLLDYLDCQECHNERAREDIFLDLSLTIENLGTLQDAIQKFITPEIMKEGNQVNCYQCDKKQDFKKGLKFKKLPPLLLIQLKRFHFDWELNKRIKLSHSVTFPKELDMKPYIDDDILQKEIQNVDDLKYSLYGVIIQSGGALGGHYYAYIKSVDDDKWHCFNDSSVRELDDKTKEFDNAFGGEKVRGTGYVLLYRQSNLKLPSNYGYFPPYLMNMIEKEDEKIKIQWEQWQKEMRTIKLTVHYADAATPPNKEEMQQNTDQKSEEYETDKEKVKFSENGKEVTFKADVEQYTFASLLQFVRELFAINDEEIPLKSSRLRKYYPEHKFVAEGYDDDNIQESKVEIAKWPKHGLHLWLETKQDINATFEYFDPNRILISLFVVTSQNTAALVDRGFVQSATFKAQDLPEGDICSVVVDSKAPLEQIKPVLYNALCDNKIVADEWCTDDKDTKQFDPQKLNLIKFDYNKIRLFSEKDKSLDDYNIKLGTMIFIEMQSQEVMTTNDDDNNNNNESKDELPEIPQLNASYRRSKLALLYEEQRLKISVQFNDPLPAKSVHDRVDELLMTPKMLNIKRQKMNDTTKKRLEFNHAIRISKECKLETLKKQIADKLGLVLNKFRLRKSSNQPELRDMNKTLSEVGISDGGLIYVEYGLPTEPHQSCITFSLYDANKLLTDPHKKKKQLAQKLFEYPFRKDIKVSVMKKEIVQVMNKLFPLYRGKYNFIEAIKVLKKEEKEQNELEIEQMKEATELSKSQVTKTETKTDTEHKANANVESISSTKADVITKEEENTNDTNINPKRLNLFGIEYVRLRKQRGAKVLEMLFDDLKLSIQIMGNKNSLNLVIEKIPIKEHFTKTHICFCLQKYRLGAGKAWNGRIYKKKEFVIDKNSKIIDLKILIANLLKKTDKSYSNRSEDEITKNISITKGFSTSPMRLNNINRLQWVHRVALHQSGIDPDAYFYRLQNKYKAEEKEEASTESSVESNVNPTESSTNTIESTPNIAESTPNPTDTTDDESIRSFNGRIFSEEEVLSMMQAALAIENDEIIGRPPFHLRNGDLIVWSDISWRPTLNQKKEKYKLDKEEAKKRGSLKKNPKFKGSKGNTLLSRFKREPQQLKIRTYEEYLEDEQKKKEKEEKQKLLEENKTSESNDMKQEETDTNKDNLSEKAKLFNAMVAEDINDIKNPKPIVRSGSV